MSKLLISGFYGFGNLGDEAILETMLARMKKLKGVSGIAVLSNNPSRTSSDFGVESISRRNPLSVMKSIMGCDVLISGGGSLLQDVTSKKSIYYYFFIIAMGILFGKKVMIYSQGIGPINTGRNRRITRFLLNRVDSITVREGNSLSDLVEMGVDEKLITVTADPVFDMAMGNEESGETFLRNRREFDPSKKTIGLSIRTKDFSDESKGRLLEDLIGDLVKSYNLVMIPFYLREDLEIAEKLREKFDKIIVLDKKMSVHDTLDIMSCFHILIGTRLHSLIFGAVCNVPLIGMTYDPKIDYFLDTLGQKPALSISEFHKSHILSEIEYIERESSKIKSEIEKDVSNIRVLLNKNDEILLDLITD